MNTRQFHFWILQFRLLLTRLGWANIGALSLCALGVMSWQLGTSTWQAREQAQRHMLDAARHAFTIEQDASPSISKSSDEERLSQFYDALGENGYAEQQLKTFFAIAAKTDLMLEQADYQLSTNVEGRYQIYRIILPVQGSYHSIREFCEQVLMTIPFASLDQIDFRRDTIGKTVVEAHLRFSLYLNAVKPEKQR